MKAVVICDDFAFAAKANATLQRIGNTAAVNVRWRTTCWPMNALNDSRMAELVLVEALDAHLIVFPAQRAQVLPPWVYNWLGQWAHWRTIEDAALAVIRDESLVELAVQVSPELCSFVREHGLNFIAHEGRATSNRAKTSPHFRVEPNVPALVEVTNFAGLAPPNSFRAFGIND
jgi:hypothetical protein